MDLTLPGLTESFIVAADPTRADAWREAREILAVRLDTIGDVLMTTPAIRAFRESGPPDRRVTLLTSSMGAQVAPHIPELDDTLVFDAPWLKACAERTSAEPDLAMIDDLRGRRFDAAVVFTVYSQNPLPSALLCHLAGIPLRLAHCRENPYQLLTDHVVEREPQEGIRHEVRRQLDLAASVGATTSDERLSFAFTDADRRRVRRVLAGLGLGPGRPWLAVHVGASAPSRRYPPARFTEVVRMLGRRGWRVVLTGSPEERALVERVRSAAGPAASSVAGRLTLAELGALIEAAPVLVSNNSGPVHIAAAVGTPVVDLYAGTNPQHTPWLVPGHTLTHPTPCAYCYRSVCPEGHHDCLRRIVPSDVVRATADVLEESREAAPEA